MTFQQILDQLRRDIAKNRPIQGPGIRLAQTPAGTQISAAASGGGHSGQPSPVTASYDAGIWTVTTDFFVGLQMQNYQTYAIAKRPERIKQTFLFSLTGSTADIYFTCVSNLQRNNNPVKDLFWWTSGVTVSSTDPETLLHQAPNSNSSTSAYSSTGQVGVFVIRLKSDGTHSIVYPASGGISQSVFFCHDHPTMPFYFEMNGSTVYTIGASSIAIPTDGAQKLIYRDQYGNLSLSSGTGKTHIGTVAVASSGRLVSLFFVRYDRIITYKDGSDNDAYLHMIGGMIAG
jgi:hypothetical protein